MKIKTVHKLKLPYQHKIKGLNWVLNQVTRSVENRIIRKAPIKSCVNPHKEGEQIILSMTTYPARIEKVVWTIKSLLNQDAEVSAFVLWLDRAEYEKVPKELEQFESYGLEIRFCDSLRSHKKYYYAIKENPDAVVITADDDVIYPENTVQKLLALHKEFPNAVICNQGRWLKRNGSDLAPYKEWKKALPKNITKPSLNIVPIGEGGVLYPPNALCSEVFNKAALLENALTADDLWLKFMELKKGTKAMITEPLQRNLCEVKTKSKENSCLNAQNIAGGQNDRVIKNLNKLYPIEF
jgi:hypothetical protein